MSQSGIRSRFSTIFDALPEDAKHELLEDHLLPLLDRVSLVDQMRIINVAEDARVRFEDMPKLDLPSKKEEVDILLDELKRDSTRGASSSRRDEIYEQIVDSLVSWLSDIWQVAFEYGVNFRLVHECLLFSSKALLQVSEATTDCKCGFMNMYIPFMIKDHRANPIKHFSYSGPLFLEDAFLWIWRDMLLKILADGKPRDLSLIPQVFNDIQAMNRDWRRLNRLLVAGGKIPSDEYDDADYEEEETDGDYVQCPNHAAHWSDAILAQVPVLRCRIAHHLFDTFKLIPSLPLYTVIVSLAPTLHSQLLAHLRTAMTHDAAAATAALDIHRLDGNTEAVLTVLTVAQPVLRPRDAYAMQAAVRMLADTSHAQAALQIVARELRDCVEVMRGHITGTGAFGGVEREDARAELAEVLRLRHNTHQRQERVERWVDVVATAAPSNGNPLTFAAFLMGFPPGIEPEDTEEPDPFLFAGIQDDDPEYEDLRAEWRPRLKERFEGWVLAAEEINSGGQEVLVRITRTVAETMPYTRGADIVNEMITRIHEKPTRYHICDALEALSSFVQAQRKKVAAEKKNGDRRKMDSGAEKNSGSGGSRRSRPADGNVPGPSTFVDAYVDDPMPGLEALD